jgi:protein TonB
VSGVVIIEAVIDKEGNVDQVKVLRGLPMGLSEEAERAVKQWRFKPGQLNGAPVDVIFNLVVNFTLNSSNSSP